MYTVTGIVFTTHEKRKNSVLQILYIIKATNSNGHRMERKRKKHVKEGNKRPKNNNENKNKSKNKKSNGSVRYINYIHNVLNVCRAPNVQCCLKFA